jgi:hypothetical protein
MNTSGSIRYAGALIALAACSACSGSLPVDSAQGKPAQGQNTVLPLNAATAGVYSVPDPTGKSKIFEYIVDNYGSYATIFDYPKNDKPIGKIKNVGGQACTNVLYGYGKKTFWIVAAYNQITEYAVPKKPIKTLTLPVGESPSSCALDPSGDLVVGILSGSHSGDLVIFKNATGTGGKPISTPLISEYFEGYDDKGNLFFDGISRQNSPQLDEMPKGSTKITTITTSNTIGLPGSIQWDGTYLTVTDMDESAMYRYRVSGTKATLQSTVPLLGASECTQTWIATGIVFCADGGNNDGAIYKYPAGGSPIATLTGPFDFPLGTVAVKQ